MSNTDSPKSDSPKSETQSAASQFEALLAQLVTKVNFVLTQQETVPPMGLLLDSAGQIEVLLAPAETEGPLDTHLDHILNGLRDKVTEGGYSASCIGFPDYDKGCVMAFWENHENLCTKVRIPVNSSALPVLDIDQAVMEDGIVSIFPAAG